MDSVSEKEKTQIVAQQTQPMQTAQKPHINVVFCIPGREFTANFLQSWTNLCNAMYQNGISFALSNAYSPVVYYARSACLRLHVLRGKNQKPFNEEFTYDYLMWIDSDIVFTPENFFALLQRMQQNRELQILSGLYLMADGHHTTCVDKWDEDFFQENGSFQFMTMDQIKTKALDNETIKNNGIFECVYIGLGWCMVRYGVFEQLEYPHFRPEFHELKQGAIFDFSSEDASFFLEMKRRGIKSYVDPNVVVGHEKMCVLR